MFKKSTIKLIVCLSIFVFQGCLQALNGEFKKDKEEQNILEQPVVAQDFELKDLDGQTVSFSDYSGKFLVIHIATTWCPYCNAEMPYLEELYQNYREKDVEVLVIDVKEPGNLVEEKLRDRFNLSFPILMDTEGEVAASYAPADVLPALARDEIMLASNMLIDPQGNIQFMSLLDSKNFDAELIELKKRLNELL